MHVGEASPVHYVGTLGYAPMHLSKLKDFVHFWFSSRDLAV